MSSYYEEALAELDHHWGTAYSITHPEPGKWVAQRLDNRETVTAADPDALFRAISADYLRKPVPREPSPLQRYDRQAHLAWYERQHPGAENWPPYPRTDDDAARYIAQYDRPAT